MSLSDQLKVSTTASHSGVQQPGTPDRERSESVASRSATITSEKNANTGAEESKNGSPADAQDQDPSVIVVGWDGPDDPENPRNWPTGRKWAAAATVSAFTFISPVASSMVAPAVQNVAADLNITSSFETGLTISIFVLAYAFGPLILAPMCEIFGRRRVLQASNLFFTAWNLGCGFAQSKEQLIAFRFLAGLGGSAPLAAGGAVLGDLWTPEDRGEAISIYSLAPLLGPAIGPVAGGWIAERSTWRWVFWSTSATALAVQVLGLIFLRETYPPVLLERKARKIRAKIDAENSGSVKEVRTIFQKTAKRNYGHFFFVSICRPFIMSAQEPIIQLFGIYVAFAYGIIYLVLTTVPTIFTEVYHDKSGIVGLHYIALGLGLTIGSQLNARIIDRVYKHLKARNNGVGEPEFRLPTTLPGPIMLPIGLLLVGWGAQEHVHWIVPDIGFAIIGIGIIVIFQGSQVYIIDSYGTYAASALAAFSFLRSVAGFGFPLFAGDMYGALGFGKANTILAAITVAIGLPASWGFWIFGKRIRTMSKRASS